MKSMQSNEKAWKSMKINEKHGINEKAWKSMEKHGNQWNSMIINGKACNSMKKYAIQ